MRSESFYGWKSLAACWAVIFINVAFTFYGASVLNAYMADGLALDRAALGSAFSLYLLMSGLPGPLVAAFVNRAGTRVTMVAGSLIVTAGALLMAAAVRTGAQAIAVYGCVIGFGALAGGVLAAQASVAFWFNRQRARAIAILHSAAAIGGFVAVPTLNLVITRAGGNWRAGWWLIAALGVLAAIIAAVFIRNRPGDLGQQPDGAATAATESGAPAAMATDDWTFAQALRGGTLWLILFCALGMSGGFALFNAHGVVHLRDLGHTPAMAAFAMSLVPIGDLSGKAVIALFGNRIKPQHLWAAMLALLALGMLLAIDAREPVRMYATALCIGAGFGGGIVLLMMLLSTTFGAAAFASLTGVTLAVQTLGGAIAPLAGGALFDTAGSYAAAFYALAALTLLGTVVLCLLRPPQRQ